MLQELPVRIKSAKIVEEWDEFDVACDWEGGRLAALASTETRTFNA
jgi:hypothetical protein